MPVPTYDKFMKLISACTLVAHPDGAAGRERLKSAATLHYRGALFGGKGWNGSRGSHGMRHPETEPEPGIFFLSASGLGISERGIEVNVRAAISPGWREKRGVRAPGGADPPLAGYSLSGCTARQDAPEHLPVKLAHAVGWSTSSRRISAGT